MFGCLNQDGHALNMLKWKIRNYIKKGKFMKVKTVKQSDLSSECFIIQMWGLSACETCQFLNTKDCGGKEIRKTKMNEKGKKIKEDGL